jgi:hypothetical protein
MVSLCPPALSSSTDRQCATTSAPGCQAVIPGPVRLRDRDLLQVQRGARITVGRLEAVEHVLFVPVQGDGPVGRGQRQRGDIGRRAARVTDRVEYRLHGHDASLS